MCPRVLISNKVCGQIWSQQHLFCEYIQPEEDSPVFIYLTTYSLVPGRCGNNFENVFFERMLRIKWLSNHEILNCEIAPRLMQQKTYDDKSALAEVIALCHQAAIHYMSLFRLSIKSLI